jgi:DHA1 family bicyclomycin/chloramphenicol resistance-like MFS transporter
MTSSAAAHATRPQLLAPLLAAMAAIAPFAIDTYLPAFEAMSAELGTTRLAVQQTLTAYLASYALMSLWHGAISDALGRRRVVVWALAVFLVASLACAAATRIEHLWIGRAFQGLFAGAGIVVGRAVARDVLQGSAAQRLLAHVAVIFGLAPAVAPIIGGWLFGAFGWRSIFLFLACYAGILILACLRWLPETLPPQARRPLRPRDLLAGYRSVFGSGRFWRMALAITANFNGFFIYVLAAPVFLMQHLGVSAQGFGWLFGPTVAGMMTGSWLSGRLAGRLAPVRTIAAGYAIMLVAAATNLALNAFLPPRLPWAVLPLAAYNLGMALTMPSLTLLIMDLFPKRLGMVSSCLGFMQSSGNALVAAIGAPLAWGSTVGLASAQILMLGAGLLLFAAEVTRQSGRDSARSG